ncbi:MAG: HAMP domain-containing protein [Rhodobacteraceae bacterium]|nr:HAMP domain-containing protein [Paracoccaceae bacterium]
MRALLQRWLWPQTLRGQLLGLLLLALIAAQVVALVFFFEERRRAVRAALAEEAVSRIASVTLLLEKTPASQQAGLLAAASTPLARFRLLDTPPPWIENPPRGAAKLRAGLILALGEMSDASWARRVQIALISGPPPKPLRSWLRHDRDDDDHDRHEHHWREPPPPHPARLASLVELRDGRWLAVEARFRRPPLQWAWPSILSMLLSAAAIVVVVTLVIGRTTNSLRGLAAAAERFGRGARGEPLPESGPEEARRLIATFNAMQDRLTRFVSDRTRLLASISHDLRTPITAMRLRVELLEDGEVKAKLAEGLDEMQRMSEAALTFAKEEAAQGPMRAVDLTALSASVVEDFADMGHDVSDVDADNARLILECRPDALKRALRNLVENAVRYGERARVTLTSMDQEVVIQVEDDGPGVPEEQIDAMFEPFARLEISRNRDTGGAGLGLSIARSIARAHGGDVRLTNRAEGGLRAEIMLPMR